MRDSYGLYVDKLQGEYMEVFQKIDRYVLTKNIDHDTMDTQMGELLDAFLLAQEEGKPVENIVGNDLEKFCKNFGTQFGWKNNLMNLFDRWKNLAWIFVVFGGIDMVFIIRDIISGEKVNIGDYWFNFNITGYLLAGLVIMVIDIIVNIVTKNLLFKKKNTKGIIKIINGLHIVTIIIDFMIIIFVLLQTDRFNFLKLPSWILFIVGGIYLIAYYWFNKERVKERKKNKVSLFGMIKEEIEMNTDVEFQKEMQKKYEKKRARMLKKGKEAWSWEEFVTYQEKDVQKAYKLKPLYDWVPLIITFPYGFLWYLDNGFGIDLIIYVVILLVTEFLVIKGMWKIVKSALDEKSAWITVEKKKMEKE